MSQTTLFRSNRTQAVRLSKDVALPDSVTEVTVTAIGDARVIIPVRADWIDWWANGISVTGDYLTTRDQPEAQERDW
ncbi:type II toxin-antitoxin system VapB family antitoxin [Microbacterium sp. A82]|uniref:type II toxin-antitoxin system VapB family antitoxin n=1 Tax=unclassified Microbacterium TaxID=2609290 RepID=UPI003F376DEE